MFGSVKEVCAELFREYGSDEPITVLIWDAHAVRYFAQEWNPNDGDVLAILETIGCSDIEEYQRYGINQQYIQDAITKIADSRSRTRQVEVSASALETVLELAAITIDTDDPESWDEDTSRGQCAIEALRAALRPQAITTKGRQSGGLLALRTLAAAKNFSFLWVRKLFVVALVLRRCTSALCCDETHREMD